MCLNIHLLLILKCFARYLGLPLIAILTCDMLWFTYFKEVITVLSPKMHFPLSVLSNVSLEDKQRLNHGGFL